MRLRYAALSDVGRVRKDNQDSAYAGPHLLVVADGVGGSARGDIASSAVVGVMRRLDEPPGNDVLGALAGAIHRSHDQIAQLVAESPEIDGTSSTVTAVVFDGTRLGVGHVGDSRGYLLRDGSLSQLTTDHTFVQSLVDEGRITEDEARVHPHRNLILRAVDGVHEPEPDVFSLEVAPGDRLMLCSDGCSGVLDNAELARLLGEGTPDHAAVTLVSTALEAGSSDNVTVVVADVVGDDEVDDADTHAASTTGPMLVGAAADQPRAGGTGGRSGGGRAARMSDTGEIPPVSGPGGTSHDSSHDSVDPEEARYAPRPPQGRPWLRRLGFVGLVVAVLAVIGFAGYQWSQGQYYVADDGDTVAVFQGVEADLPGLAMHHVEQASTVRLADLPSYNQRQVRDGISANDLDDARGILSRLRRLAACGSASGSTTPSPSASASPTATATAGPTPSPTASPTASSTATPTTPSGSSSSSCPENP
ncbi:MAG: serine/threonine-protein phosphatase [Marmoricola sp.]|nr:serine/threonine-protein phosphatase [Marmoricola sp.]